MKYIRRMPKNAQGLHNKIESKKKKHYHRTKMKNWSEGGEKQRLAMNGKLILLQS